MGVVLIISRGPGSCAGKVGAYGIGCYMYIHTCTCMCTHTYVCAIVMLAYMYVTCTLPQVYENAGYATQTALVTTLPADRVCGMCTVLGSMVVLLLCFLS